MVTAAPRKLHVHIWEIDNHGKAACKCGEIRQYNQATNMKENSFTVLKAGDPAYKDPPGTAAPFSQINKPAQTLTEKLTEKPAATHPAAANLQPAPKHKGGDMYSRHKYYEGNKAAILKSIETIGLKKTMEYFGIKPSSWVYIKRRWEGKATHVIHSKPERQVVPEEKVESTAPKNPLPASYLIDYWRKRAALKSTGASEAVIMHMTADALETL